MQGQIDRDAFKQPGHMIIEHIRKGRLTRNIPLIFSMVFALCIAPAMAQGPTGKDLKKFYQQSCAKCHGPDGSAVSADGKSLNGQDFTDQDWQRDTADDRMVKAILKGKFFGLAMPRFKDALTEEEAMEMVTNIIRNSKKGQVITPDAEKPNAPG